MIDQPTEQASKIKVTIDRSGRVHKFTCCRHCKKGHGYRSRGLCNKCWSNVSIREQYPCNSAHRGNRGNGLTSQKSDDEELTDSSGTLLPKEPTQAIPGTYEKLKILTERANKGVSLWHPKDLTLKKCREEITREIQYIDEHEGEE